MTAVKIYTCILANIPSKQTRQIKITPRLDLRFWLGKLVQLGFVIHMQYLTKFYCSISFALKYIRVLSDFLNFIFMR